MGDGRGMEGWVKSDGTSWIIYTHQWQTLKRRVWFCVWGGSKEQIGDTETPEKGTIQRERETEKHKDKVGPKKVLEQTHGSDKNNLHHFSSLLKLKEKNLSFLKCKFICRSAPVITHDYPSSAPFLRAGRLKGRSVCVRMLWCLNTNVIYLYTSLHTAS